MISGDIGGLPGPFQKHEIEREMKRTLTRRLRRCAVAFLLGGALTSGAHAAGGYFVLGYGPYAHQSAGASTATGFDAFAGSSNPGKLAAAGTRLDLGMLTFLPSRRMARTGSGTAFDFKTKSRNDVLLIPDGAYAHHLNDIWAWGITFYGNGGLNTEYHETTGIPGSNNNPSRCGNKPGNYFGGCGELGFDLLQVIVAPTLSYRPLERHTFGIAPLLAYQQFRVYGLQAFEALSREPDRVTNKGVEGATGAGVRFGWLGTIWPWMNVGATYATRVHMQDFKEYRGLLAGGSFDIPDNFSVGVAVTKQEMTLAIDIQRIFFGHIPALANGVLNTLEAPEEKPLGSRDGSGFHWTHQTNYRVGLTWAATPHLDVRAGFAYGRVPQADSTINTASFAVLAPTPALNLTAGFSFRPSGTDEIHFAYGAYRRGEYSGDSAVFPGATEKVEPRVDTIYLAWSRRW